MGEEGRVYVKSPSSSTLNSIVLYLKLERFYSVIFSMFGLIGRALHIWWQPLIVLSWGHNSWSLGVRISPLKQICVSKILSYIFWLSESWANTWSFFCESQNELLSPSPFRWFHSSLWLQHHPWAESPACWERAMQMLEAWQMAQQQQQFGEKSLREIQERCVSDLPTGQKKRHEGGCDQHLQNTL